MPESAADSLPDDQEPLTISINSKGEIYIQEHQVTYQKMVPKLLAIAKNRTDTRIYVRGDKNINYGRGLEVMGTLIWSRLFKSRFNLRALQKIGWNMTRSLIYSLAFHSLMILLTILSLPFMLREPVELPPIVSVELIQISDKTNIPYAPKARKIIEETKKEEKGSFRASSTSSKSQRKARPNSFTQ